MATNEHHIRVVLVSPADVAEEREAAQGVIQELNRGIAASRGLLLSLWRWEADARSGLHLKGPQGLIDELMDVERADIVIGVFWRHFGTATHDAASGTEHELRSAWASWRRRGRPDVMVYFSDRPYAPKSPAEARQFARVLEFKDQLPSEQLWWTYTSPLDFERLLREHLVRYLEVARARSSPGGAPESAAAQTRRDHRPEHDSARDSRKVAVMHGRDAEARAAVFDLLRRLGLHPMEWDELVNHTGSAAPYSGEVVAVAFEVAQAVVVVLTPDDIGFLHPDLHGVRESEDDREPTGQARLNVVLEAGMALQSRPMQTVLVEIGRTRAISDLAGRNTVRLDGGAEAINSLATRLERAGCPVDRGRSDWLDAGSFSRLDALSRTPPQATTLEISGDPPTAESIARNLTRLEGLQTGGDTFCYIMFYHFDMDASVAQRLVLIRKGDYSLHNVRLVISDLDTGQQVMTHEWGEVDGPAHALDVRWVLQPSVYYRVFFNARNGDWHQDLQLRRSDAAECWLASTRVSGRAGDVRFAQTDHGFDVEFGEPKWRP